MALDLGPLSPFMVPFFRSILSRAAKEEPLAPRARKSQEPPELIRQHSLEGRLLFAVPKSLFIPSFPAVQQTRPSGTPLMLTSCFQRGPPPSG